MYDVRKMAVNVGATAQHSLPRCSLILFELHSGSATILF